MVLERAELAMRRTWHALSALGVTKGSDWLAVTRTNHLLILSAVATGPLVVLYLIFGPDWWPAAAVSGAAFAVWGACLWANARGAHLTAAVVALLSMIVLSATMTWLMSSSSGYQLNLLATGTLAYVVLPASSRALRIALVALSTAVVIAVTLTPSLHRPELDVSEGAIDILLAMNLVQMTMAFYVLAWFNHRYLDRERRTNSLLLAEARTLAQTDTLTGVLNRRGVAPVLAAATRRPMFALALADLDRFKRINDRLGHGAGDVVLANVARTMAEAVGVRGTVARWGGEEFLVVMPDATYDEAVAAMEQLCQAVADRHAEDGSTDGVTVSVGVAHARAHSNKDEVLRAADHFLYEAKASGRNMVVHGSMPSA